MSINFDINLTIILINDWIIYLDNERKEICFSSGISS